MHGRAKGTADHYWPWAVFFRQGSGLEGVRGVGGWTRRGTGRTDVWTDVQTDRNPPLCSIGHRPLRVRGPKREGRRKGMKEGSKERRKEGMYKGRKESRKEEKKEEKKEK